MSKEEILEKLKEALNTLEFEYEGNDQFEYAYKFGYLQGLINYIIEKESK